MFLMLTCVLVGSPATADVFFSERLTGPAPPTILLQGDNLCGVTCAPGFVIDVISAATKTKCEELVCVPEVFPNRQLPLMQVTVQVAANQPQIVAQVALLAQLAASAWRVRFDLVNTASGKPPFFTFAVDASGSTNLGTFATKGLVPSLQASFITAINAHATPGSSVRLSLLPLPIKPACPSPFSNGSAIDGELEISPSGRTVRIHGPIECPDAQHVRVLRATVTQESTGAFARGRWHGDCDSVARQWNLDAHLVGSSIAFRPGAAQVCAAAVFAEGRKPRDSRQWCVDVTLDVAQP